MHICELEDAGIMILTGLRIYQSPDGKSQMDRSIFISFVVHARAKGGCQITILPHSLVPHSLSGKLYI
jgi:hypothetical protein